MSEEEICEKEFPFPTDKVPTHQPVLRRRPRFATNAKHLYSILNQERLNSIKTRDAGLEELLQEIQNTVPTFTVKDRYCVRKAAPMLQLNDNALHKRRM